MDAATYFLANRIWWFVALLIGPVAAAIVDEVLVGIGVSALLAVSSAVVFDTDRAWWAAEVRRHVADADRSRAELRRLNFASVAGLLAGLGLAVVIG